MAESTPQKTSLKMDLIVIVALVVILIGGAFIAGRVRRQREAQAPPPSPTSPPERIVDPTLIRYNEANSIRPDIRRMRGLAVTSDDHILLAGDFTIIEYSKDLKELRRFEVDNAPRCLATSPDDKLIYAGAGDHVEVLDRKTGTVTVWKSLGKEAFLTSVATTEKAVIVGDSGYRKLWVLDLDGNVSFTIDASHAEATDGNVPSTYFDVTADTGGAFWATDAGRHGVIHYSAEGQPLERWGEAGTRIEAFGGCCNPTHISMGPDNTIYTVEKKPDLVKFYHIDGQLAGVVAGPKAFDPKTFIPDMAVDSTGRVLLVDPKQKAVRTFVPKAER